MQIMRVVMDINAFYDVDAVHFLIQSNTQVCLLSDLYKSDWKLQGNTNTQLKLLCRASYTGK